MPNLRAIAPRRASASRHPPLAYTEFILSISHLSVTFSLTKAPFYDRLMPGHDSESFNCDNIFASELTSREKIILGSFN